MSKNKSDKIKENESENRNNKINRVLSIIAICVSLMSIAVTLHLEFSKMPIEKYFNAIVPELNVDLYGSIASKEGVLFFPLSIANTSISNAYDIYFYGDLNVNKTNQDGNSTNVTEVKSMLFNIPTLLSSEVAYSKTKENIDIFRKKINKIQNSSKIFDKLELGLYFFIDDKILHDVNFRINLTIVYKNSLKQCFKHESFILTHLFDTRKEIASGIGKPNIEPISENEYSNRVIDRENISKKFNEFSFQEEISINLHKNLVLHKISNLSENSLFGIKIIIDYKDSKFKSIFKSCYCNDLTLSNHTDSSYQSNFNNKEINLEDNIPYKQFRIIKSFSVSIFFKANVVNSFEHRLLISVLEKFETKYDNQQLRVVSTDYYNKVCDCSKTPFH